MSDRLSDSQMLKLVEIYQDYDCLWNVTSKLYRNRDARESAYKQIAERLNITGISNKDIPIKIKNLRSSYYQELKRIEASTRSGASQDSVYKPKVSWFTTADGFLRTFRNNQETVSSLCILSSTRIHQSIRLLRRMSQICGAIKKIAVCQMTSHNDKAENLSVVRKLVEDASKSNAEMIFFPEACDYICDNKQEMLSQAEPIVGGETVTQYRDLAKQHNVWLSMGGIHEKDETNPKKVYNTHILIDNVGSIVQSYRKLHLFDVEIPDKNVRLKESDFANAGEHVVTPVHTPIGRVGLAICYDMRFPELGALLASLGAQVLTYPSAFTKQTGQAHWETLLRSRAIENQCYVVAAAQVGAHNPKRSSYGQAICIDPWGTVIADCGTEESPTFMLADISMDKLDEVRRNMPVFQHRRKGVYSLYALSLRNEPLPEHCTTKHSQTPPRDIRDDYKGPTSTFGHVLVPNTCIFFTGPYSFAFVNLRCVIPGHVLVAPKRLVERNKDLTDEEAADFYKTIRVVQRLMERVQGTNSCTVTIQDGPDAGQTVKHLHCHIMPRKKGDFIDNDLIYLELAKHDQLQAKGYPTKPARTLQEMESEAAMLRRELLAMQSENDNT